MDAASQANRAVALVIIAVFGVHLSRFFVANDVANFVCPHHVSPAADAPEPSSEHAGHDMGQGYAGHSENQPSNRERGLRCCCRHLLDGTITTLILDAPTNLMNAPLPDGVQRVLLAPSLFSPEGDLSPPFKPPRV